MVSRNTTLVPSLGLRIGPACEASLSIGMRREHVPPQKIKIISMAADWNMTLYRHLYTSLFARKAAATSEKKHQTHNNKNKQTKERKKTTLKSGVLVNSVSTFIHQRTRKHLLTSVNIKLRQRTR